MFDENEGGERLEGEEPRRTHKVTKTEVVRARGGKFGVKFEFDDGWVDYAEVVDRKTAEFSAAAQRGQDLVIGAHPLLLNAEKADELRNRTPGE
jgi:hypothetical protein